jgi:hypothetical protein
MNRSFSELMRLLIGQNFTILAESDANFELRSDVTFSQGSNQAFSA